MRATSVSPQPARRGSPRVPLTPERRGADLERLARGSSLNLAGSFVSALLNLLLPVVITRSLTRGAAGTFFEAITLFTILINVGALGADTGLLRAIPRARALDRQAELRPVLRAALVPPAVASVAISVLLVLLGPHLTRLAVGPAADQQKTFLLFLYVLAAALPIATVYTIAVTATRGFGPVKPLVYVEKIGRTAAQTAFVALCQWLAPSALLLVLAWSVPYACAGIVIAGWLQRLLLKGVRPSAAVAPPPRPYREVSREFWSFARPRAVSRILSVGLQRVDILLVGAIRGPADAAVYLAATRFLILGLMFVQAIQQVMAPKISEMLTLGQRERAIVMYQTTTAWLTLVSWPLYLTFAVFAAPLLRVFGGSYQRGSMVVVILCLVMLVSTFCGPVDTVLLMGGRSSLSLINTGLALAVNIGLDLVLIPRYGINGAALGWMAAILVNNLLPLWEIHRFLDMHPFGAAARRASVTALACYVPIPLLVRWLLGDTVVGICAATVLSTVIYGAVMLAQRQVLDLDALIAVGRRSRAGLEPGAAVKLPRGRHRAPSRASRRRSRH